MIRYNRDKNILTNINEGLTNRIKKWIFLITISCLSLIQPVKAQMDPQFSNNMFNLVYANPAAAGRDQQMNAFGLWRNQWRGFTNNPVTWIGSFDTNLKILGQESGIGFTVMDDNLGLFNNLSINFIYSYRKRIWNGVLAAGVNVGFINMTWDGTQVYIPDDPTATEYMSAIDDYITAQNLNTESTDTKFDMGLGAFFDHEKFYAGISVSRLTRPELELSSTASGLYFFYNRVYYATAGYNFLLTDRPKYEIKPSVFLKSDGVISQADLNCNIWYDKKYYGGLSYRLQDGFIVLAGIKLKTGLNIGYSFDMTTSRMKYGTAGSHELYVSYSFAVDMNKQLSKHKSVRFL